MPGGKPTITRTYDAAPPKKAHLGVYTSPNVVAPLVVGCYMGVFPEGDKPLDSMGRMILWKVERKRLTFKCACNPTCKAVYVYSLREVGSHG